MILNGKIDNLKEDLIKVTSEIIKIKSVEEEAKEGMPYGEGVAKALDYALNTANKLGFKTVNLDGYVGYAEYGEGEDYIGILGHLDVVPEGDGWIYPPYGGEIHDGKLYGRGTMDDKGPMMSSLFALKAVKESGLKLSKRVRIIFGTNEETGCNEIEHYLEREKPPVAGFTPDAEYPIIYAEKGITIFDLVKDLNKKPSGDIIIKSIKGGQRANMVPDYCEVELLVKDIEAILKAVENFKDKKGYNLTAEILGDKVVVKSYGVSAHGSLPHLGKNAIMQLFAFIDTLTMEPSDIVDFIKFFNKYVGMECDGASFGVGLSDEVSGKLSFNVGVISMSDEKVRMSLNLRYPVTYKYEDLETPLLKTLENKGIVIKNMVHQKPLYFEKEHPLIKTLQKVYEEQTGFESKLLAIGGGTYAKEMPNIVAFGPILPGRPDLDHQANECVELEDLILNAKIYAHAIYELAK